MYGVNTDDDDNNNNNNNNNNNKLQILKVKKEYETPATTGHKHQQTSNEAKQ